MIPVFGILRCMPWHLVVLKIDFEKYMDKFPELQKLREEGIFKEVIPMGYNVYWGKKWEVDISLILSGILGKT